MNNTPTIDFVILWVDGNDPQWQKNRQAHSGVCGPEGNSEVRYRDWETLRYWFRGVEKFAPWVRYVYFITDNQLPPWLNTAHPKLKWVRHTDFIPGEYLPTFSSHVIEWNLHRIPGLSERFVYFNDDVFLIDKTKPEDFFSKGLPCDSPCLGPLYPEGFFSYILFNNIQLLNRHFSLRGSIRENPGKWIKGQNVAGLMKLLLYGRRDLIPNSVAHHIHIPLQKSMFKTLWEKEGKLIHDTCLHKFRNKEDVSVYCVRDWQLFSGTFCPRRPIGKFFQTASMAKSKGAISYLSGQKGKVICLNDSEDEQDFALHKQQILEAFQKLLPERSAFETGRTEELDNA